MNVPITQVYRACGIIKRSPGLVTTGRGLDGSVVVLTLRCRCVLELSGLAHYSVDIRYKSIKLNIVAENPPFLATSNERFNVSWRS